MQSLFLLAAIASPVFKRTKDACRGTCVAKADECNTKIGNVVCIVPDILDTPCTTVYFKCMEQFDPVFYELDFGPDDNTTHSADR